MKLWKKNIELDPRIERYTVGDDTQLDLRLVQYDCEASIAHARMLGKIGILKAGEVKKLVAGLRDIQKLDKDGRFAIRREDEDCHTAIENHLTRTLGEAGKKIHTARSRNDQVLAALRLYYRDRLDETVAGLHLLIRALGSLKKRCGKVRYPGFTHTRKAMASSFGLWADGFAEAIEDDRRLIQFTAAWINRSPLGTGAGYGIPLRLDRAYAAKLLGFSGVQKNPIAVQNSRGKFEATIVHALGQVLYDLNRMSSDLIFFSLPDLGYVSLPDAFCTGSSIMPQKKNPDVLELMRAQVHRVAAMEAQLRNAAVNLISGYHRDLQLTKKPVMEAFDITLDTLAVAKLVVENLKVDAGACRRAMTDEVLATEKVYELVRRGMPFREAYRLVGKKYG
jgi:argininosuccinate lyase